MMNKSREMNILENQGIIDHSQVVVEETVHLVYFVDLPKTKTPVLSYCRQLIKEGNNPNNQLHGYRGAQLDLVVQNIGLAAKLTVRENPSPHFAKYSLHSRVGVGLGLDFTDRELG